ncbi:MAG TPA: DUF4259 domain-containing protein [Devosiaceae bacterium]|jgi:hypothetical protein
MGTWSTASFGNDGALDWFGDLREARSALPFIEQTLNTGSTDAVIAAGAVLAVLSGKHASEVPNDIVAWCAGKAAPSAELRQAAIGAIQAIIDDPEADGHDAWAELGEDDEDYLAWLANLKTIQAQLA